MDTAFWEILASAFAIGMLVLIVPGPNMILTLRAAQDSARGGMAAALGIATADLVWALAGAAGLAASLAASVHVYEVFRWIGGGYLVWVGVRLLLPQDGATAASAAPDTAGRRWFTIGFLTCMTNPKAIAFYAAVFAALLPADASSELRAILVAQTVLQPLLFGLLLTWVGRRKRIRHLLGGAGAWVTRTAGAMVAAFGLRIILADR